MEPYFPVPRVLVSRCLGFGTCRYDGQAVKDPLVEQLKRYVKMVPVCPEDACGLGVPRAPVRLLEEEGELQAYQPATDMDVTAILNSFITPYFAHRPLIDGAVVKGKSPCCGLWDAKRYQGQQEPKALGRGSGIFGSKLLELYPEKALEDESRLADLALREHFYIKLFTLARFRHLSRQPSMGAIEAFHSSNRLLFSAYNEQRYGAAGEIVANKAEHSIDQVCRLYYHEMVALLDKPFAEGGIITSLYLALAGVSKELSGEEHSQLVDLIESYRDERVDLHGVTAVLEVHAERLDNAELLEQTLLQPYPRGLSAHEEKVMFACGVAEAVRWA